MIQGLIFVAAAAVMVKLASTQVVPYIYFSFRGAGLRLTCKEVNVWWDCHLATN